MKRALTIFAVVVLTLAASGLILAQSDPAIGTWKLNVAKSKFSGPGSLKIDTRTYEVSGGQVT